MFAMFVIFFSLLISLKAQASEITIRTCLSRGATDYATYLKTIDVPNADRRLMERAAKNVKAKIVFEDSEIKRCLQYAKTGQVDAVYPISLQGDLLSLFAVPPDGAKLTEVTWNIYMLKSSAPLQPLKSLRDVSGPIGASFDYIPAKNLFSAEVIIDQSAKTPEDLLRQLLTGRVHAIIQDNFDFIKASRSFNSSEIAKIKLAFSFRQQSAYLLLTKPFAEKNPVLSKQFYDAIMAEKNNPLYIKESKILKRALQ